MDSSTFLIIGANGQLGTALREKYPQAKAVDSDGLDITDAEAVQAFDWSAIKIIINAAAYTNVDGAESSEGRVIAWKVNAVGVANLTAIARQHDLTLVHISSEYVFDGTKTPHVEAEPFSPLGVYAQTKAAGDIAASVWPKHYILRTSWVIGEGKNFVRTMLSLGAKGISPSVVGDQIGRLTFTSELVRAIDHLLGNSHHFGTYNVSNSGDPASWADVTRAIFELGSFADLTVTDTTTEAYFADKPEASPRPLLSTMDLTKLESTGFQPKNWHEDLKVYIENEKSKETAV
jgi:dTDP-4-dehydrorhamnose 3,5-epimerase/reductase